MEKPLQVKERSLVASSIIIFSAFLALIIYYNPFGFSSNYLEELEDVLNNDVVDNVEISNISGWKKVGLSIVAPTFTNRNTTTSVVFDSEDIAYIAYGIYDNKEEQRKMIAMKMSTNDWGLVGADEVKADRVHKFAIDVNNIPYAYVGNWGKEGVYEIKRVNYNDKRWESETPISSQGMLTGWEGYPVVLFDSHDISYLFYHPNTHSNVYNSLNYFSLQKFNGTKWEFVGPTEVSFDADSAELIFDSNDEPYVFGRNRNEDGSNEFIIKKWDGVNWADFASIKDGVAPIGQAYLLFDSQNTPYIAYRKIDEIIVIRLNGTNWEALSVGRTQPGLVEFIFAIDKNDIPHIAYRLAPGLHLGIPRLNVIKWNGMIEAGRPLWDRIGYLGKNWNGITWEDVGPVDSTDTILSIVFDSKNIPYVVFENQEYEATTIIKYSGIYER